MLEAPAAAPPTEVAQPSLAERLEQAKREIGNIDKDLRRQYPGNHISAPLDNAQTRLAKGIQAAGRRRAEPLVPGAQGHRGARSGPVWAQALPRGGRLGTYCITVESNHAPDGLDTIKTVSSRSTPIAIRKKSRRPSRNIPDKPQPNTTDSTDPDTMKRRYFLCQLALLSACTPLKNSVMSAAARTKDHLSAFAKRLIPVGRVLETEGCCV